MREREVLRRNRVEFAQAAWEDAEEFLATAQVARRAGDYAGWLRRMKAAQYCRYAAVLALQEAGLPAPGLGETPLDVARRVAII
jgi:hypothetical protein